MQHISHLIRGAKRLVAISVFVALLLAAGIPWFAVAAPLGATSPALGAAASYLVLGGQTVTNTGPTTLSGDLGVSPGSAITGFPPGIVNPPGMIHAADANAADAQIANTAAFTFIDQACTTTYAGIKDLVGANLVPGVYCADAFRLSGTLTLSGSGVWIFKSAADLITSGTANIVGGDPCNVWWRVVSSATLGSNTSLIGNVLASTSVSLQTSASLSGRVLVQTGSVTLDNNVVSSACAVANTPVPTATGTPVLTVTETPVLTATETLVPAPTNTRKPTRKKTPVPVETPAPESAETSTPIPAETPPIPAETSTPVPAETSTPVPAETITPLTATATAPIPARLPRTGGDPPQRANFLWIVVLAVWFIGAVVFGLSIRARRRERQIRR